MKELIKLSQQTINNQGVNAVSARELHRFLESRQDFSTWIKNRIRDYDFIENIDYIRFHKKMEANNATMVEYYISLDMAKELSMVERNQRGKEARQYFIECERKLLEISQKDGYLLSIIKANTELDRALALSEYEVGYVRPLEKYKEEAEPKVTYHDLVLACDDLLTITQIAQDYPITNRQLNKILADKGIQYKDKSGMWCIYAKYGAEGYAQTFTYTYTEDGRQRSKPHLKWTQKGRLFIYNLLKEEGILPTCEEL